MTTEVQNKDKGAVLDVVKGVSDAWNNADPDAFVAEYLEDATAILPGTYLTSRAAIRDAMAFSFNGALKGTRSSDKVLDVRLLNADTAVAITETGVLFPAETEAPPERTAYATWLLAKRDGKWMLAAYCNTPSTSQAGTADAMA